MIKETLLAENFSFICRSGHDVFHVEGVQIGRFNISKIEGDISAGAFIQINSRY